MKQVLKVTGIRSSCPMVNMILMAGVYLVLNPKQTLSKLVENHRILGKTTASEYGFLISEFK